MKSSRIGPAGRRWLGVAVGLALLMGVGVAVQAQDKPAEQPDPMKFSSEAIMLFFTIKPEGSADFESIMGKVKEVLGKSDKPERKAQAGGWNLYKINQQQNGNWTYICVIDPVNKDASYDPFKILGEGLPPAEVGELYKKFQAALVMPNPLSMAPVQVILKMGGGGSF
jgi:hypothetical protein